MHSFIQSLIIIIDWTFGLTVLILTVWLVISKLLRNLIQRYELRRHEHFQSLLHRALKKDQEALKQICVEKWGDKAVLWKMYTDLAENFSGAITLQLAHRLEELGFFQDALNRLHSRWWWVRAEAAYQMGLFKNPEAEEPLLRALKDSSEDVGLAVSRALTRLKGCDAFPPILARYAAQWGSPSLNVASVLFEMGPEASPYLAQQLPELARGSQLLAIDILGYFKNPQSVAPLLGLMVSPDQEVRARIVKGLGHIGHPSALPAVIAATQDDDSTVRLLACGALVQWVTKESIAALVACLDDASLLVRLRAAQTLSLMGTSGNKALAAARPHSKTSNKIVQKYLRKRNPAA